MSISIWKSMDLFMLAKVRKFKECPEYLSTFV